MPRFLALGALILGLVFAACGGGDDGGDGSIDAFLAIVPSDALDFYYVDVDEVVADGDLDSITDNLADSNDSVLDEFEIDLDDVASSARFTFEDGTFSMAIYAPDLDVDEFVERLEDDFDADADEDGDSTTYTLGDSEQVVLALPGDIWVFRLTADLAEEVIDAATGDRSNFGEEDVIAALIDRLDDGPLIYLDIDCGDIDECEAYGESASSEGDGELSATLAVLFEDEDAAEDAENDIEESPVLDFILGPAESIDTEVDGEFVVVTYSVEAEDGSY